MEFQSVEEAAKRLQVTPRAIQKWAKEGKIPGVSQVGRTWLIPCSFSGRQDLKKDVNQPKKSMIRPLLDGDFVPGQCLDYVMTFPEGVQRDVMAAQYYYFSGRSDQAIELAKPYLTHEDPVAALLASVTYSFAKLSLGNPHMFQRGQEYIIKYAQMCLKTSQDPQVRAYAVYIMTMVHVVMHVECPPMPALGSELKQLPMGARLHAGYLMAHEAYLEKDYARCLGIAEMALALCGDTYVIPAIYLHLIASVARMEMRQVVEAKDQFEQAYQLARPDNLITVFCEHFGMLQGLLEVTLKRHHPEDYGVLLKQATKFSEGWRKVHNASTNRTVADHLTAVEMTVASLFYRGWAVKEISTYMDISPRMIRHHISVVYEKLGISHREELAQYVVR